MSDIAEATRPAPPPAPRGAPLSREQKAAIVIAALGPDGAAPILERFDERTLRRFARGMSGLKKVSPETVRETLSEFLDELGSDERGLKGGLPMVREILGQVINDATLSRIIDEVETPSLDNVWDKLMKVDDAAIATFLAREHPQTSAVVLSKLPPEQAARVLDRLEPDLVKRIVTGLTRAPSLDARIVAAIGDSVSRDFLSGRRAAASPRDPADSVGAIMNYVSSALREPVLAHLDDERPRFAADVKKRMFTFDHIPARIEPRDVTAILRTVDSEVLLMALRTGETNAPKTTEFLLASISKRMAEQLREDMAGLGQVRTQDGERCQAEIIRGIRRLEQAGELRLIVEEEG